MLKRRTRLLRLHLPENQGSIEGVFLGYEAGHYRLVNAKLMETAGASIQLEGESWVPRERVLLAQRLG